MGMLNLGKYPEWRILGVLGVIVLGWYLLSMLGGLVGIFSDVLVIIFLAWILAFVIEPVVVKLANKGLGRTGATLVSYGGVAVILGLGIWIVLPTMVPQLAQFATVIPQYLPQNSLWTPRIEGFITSTIANSVVIASQVASGLANVLLVYILSVYFSISRKEISETILKIIPDQYEEDYRFFEEVINKTFASFLRIQMLMGFVLGVVTLVVMLILQVNFAVSTSLVSGILAMIPVVGPILFLIPPILAAATVSVDKVIIVTVVLILIAQLVYNVWAPRLLGKALRIHPIIVLLSFLVGYKMAGIWGAIFSVPVTSAITIIARDLILYWKEEADRV